MEDPDPLALDQQPLQEVVRERCWAPELPPTEAEVTEGLKAAGVHPSNEKERERFRRLAVAQAHFTEAEERARLGDYIDRATAEMPGATDEEIHQRASHMAQLRHDEDDD